MQILTPLARKKLSEHMLLRKVLNYRLVEIEQGSISYFVNNTTGEHVTDPQVLDEVVDLLGGKNISQVFTT